MKKQKKVDLIVSSQNLKNAIKKRISELNLSYSDIIKDAEEKNVIGITKSSISIYFNSNYPASGCLSQKNVIWLALRYGIDLKVIIKLIEPYDEKAALKKLKKYFP